MPKRILWIGLPLALVALIGLLSIIGPQRVLQDLYFLIESDTEYASGYSEKAFETIRIGDPEPDVIAALGAPLDKYLLDPYRKLIFSKQEQPDFAQSAEANWQSSYTVFEFKKGVLESVYGQQFRGQNPNRSYTMDLRNSLGLSDTAIEKLKSDKTTEAQIEALYGKPAAIFESTATSRLRYSRSPSSSNYRLRIIDVDAKGRVCRIRQEIYWD
ncbi:MAG: hypothetical protein HKN23_20450 [Verrucomicrobiales bacterium]|nr:hypothetical protein [Verrucomicrobiales bacterium]